MKKFVLSAIAASLVASPMAATTASAAQYGAPYQQRHDQQRHETVVRHQPGRTVVVQRAYRQSRPQFRNGWRKGERFDYRQARNYRVINDYRAYRGRHLYAPPRGYHWVQSGNDAVLVAVTGGLIGAVLAGAFN